MLAEAGSLPAIRVFLTNYRLASGSVLVCGIVNSKKPHNKASLLDGFVELDETIVADDVLDECVPVDTPV